MNRNRAAYMREYRKRKKVSVPIVRSEVEGGLLVWDCPACGQRVSSMLIPGSDGRARIRELEAEVAQLKGQLATKEPIRPLAVQWEHAFRPVPKPGKH